MTAALPGKPFKARRSSIGQAAQTEKQSVATPEIGPAPEPATEPATVAPPARPRAATVVAPEPQPQTRNKRISGESKDILLSMPEDEKARMVNTIAHTTPRTGIKHQSKFIRYAVAKLCEELERDFNNGVPFDAPAAEPI